MKIALVTPYDYPYPGGVNEHVTALDHEFRALGHKTRIIAASTANEDVLGDHVFKVSGAISPMPISGSTARITLSPQVYQRVKQILNAEKFDVVHVHEPTVPLLSLAVLLHSRALNIGTFHAYRESNAMYEYAAPFLKQVFKHLDGRIFVSDAVREYITQYFPGDYVTIPNGVNWARFASPSITPIERFNDGRPNILFVGRLETRKGFRHLLRAYPYIKSVVPNARLIVVGAFGDKEKAPFLRYARAHKLRGVHFVGHVSPEELPRYYRTATVFCAPNTGFESFGIILLEAMAAGVPIVASDIAGFRTVVEDCRDGLLVAPEDDRAIAHAIIELLTDSARRAQMGECGNRKAQQYDWSIVAQRVLAYYRDLMATRDLATQIQSSPGKRRIVRVPHWLTWRRTRNQVAL
jgi:phosphatidylinositol alpha-mannosyltransferase